MSDRDPFDLRRLGPPPGPVARPPAAEIRRRAGLRRHRRILTVVAGTAAGIVLAAAVLFGASGVLSGNAWWDADGTASPSRGEPPIAGTPGSPTPAGLAWDNVPTTEQIWVREPGDLRLNGQTSGPDAPDFSISSCMQDPAELGHTSLLMRRFASEPLSASQTVAVMEFSSVTDATRAREMISGWYADDACGATLRSGFDVGRSNSGTELSVPSASAAEFANAFWSDDPDGMPSTWEDAALVQVDRRLAWIVYTVEIQGQDHHCGTDPSGPEDGMCVPARQAESVAKLLR